MKHITLGILGGGQLGRMSAMAAARLGISVIIYCPEKDSPASQVVKETIVASYDDKDMLKKLSNNTDFISYEFENIPTETIKYLNSLKKNSTRPDTALLDVSQDRVKEKTFLNECGIETARWAPISSIEDIKLKVQEWETDGFILKTARFGYDGKGQIKCDATGFESNNELLAFLEETKEQSLVMEDIIPFDYESSVIIARDNNGKTVTYGPMLNEHKNHILDKTYMPANVSKQTEDRALESANKIADDLDLTGILTVEFFVLQDGQVLANEIAPRTHNSGHWSIDACAVSQFENHIRAVAGLPVGKTTATTPSEMLNLIGDDINNIADHYCENGACIHLYGKSEAKDGRKMGHITFLKEQL